MRLNNYDYRTPGWYFVTICVKNKQCLFGEIRNGIVGLNQIGLKAFKNWQAIPDHFDHVQLDEFIVMPNHLHGLIGIKSFPDVNRRDVVTDENKNQRMSEISPKSGSLGTIIRSYKGSVTSWCNRNRIEYFNWQTNYYDQIVRDKKSFNRIREYIYYNPIRWHQDDSYIQPRN